jgi:endonuclease YncB( thermonuclease family)
MPTTMRFCALLRLGLALALCGPIASALAGERLEGPVEAQVERVIDGDTFAVRARIWLGQELLVAVRPRGVDAPELFRPKCSEEQSRAEAAKAFLRALLAGQTVRLSDIENDKFAGRIDARVTLPDMRDLAEVLIASGHGAPYDGKTHPSFCPVETGEAHDDDEDQDADAAAR